MRKMSAAQSAASSPPTPWRISTITSLRSAGSVSTSASFRSSSSFASCSSSSGIISRRSPSSRAASRSVDTSRHCCAISYGPVSSHPAPPRPPRGGRCRSTGRWRAPAPRGRSARGRRSGLRSRPLRTGSADGRSGARPRGVARARVPPRPYARSSRLQRSDPAGRPRRGGAGGENGERAGRAGLSRSRTTSTDAGSGHDLDPLGGRIRAAFEREHLAQGADRDLELVERRLARRQPLQPEARARAASSRPGCRCACRRSGSARRRSPRSPAAAGSASRSASTRRGRPKKAKTKIAITITQSRKAVPQRGWIRL